MTKFLSAWRAWLLAPLVAGVLIVTSILGFHAFAGAQPKKVAYTDLVTMAEAGHVASVEVAEGVITARLRDAPGTIAADRIPAANIATFVDDMRAHGVTVYGSAEHYEWLWPLAWAVLPLLALPAILYLVFFANGKGARPMSFGSHKAKLYDRSRDNPVTFADVAGVEEAKSELAEVVGFLKEGDRYRAVGARVPKGVLLVGPPGTGKTLLAKAVAGEAGVPFFAMSGSEFVEMFVGVGASRVRDLFLQAKERAPCIIFIDELDAVGKSRGGGPSLVGNDERDQTLNQLLVEMDGFDSENGIVIMAATNRPEVLDRALLRPGRFDRDVLVDRPDVRGREAILAVHAKKLRLCFGVDLRLIAQRTPGMVGAELANVVNEAALASVRRGGDVVTSGDFEEAIDRMQLGLKKQCRAMTEVERRRVAFHESGHALVALTMEHADPVHRVTIIPRTIGALGVTLQLPDDDKHLATKDELSDRICVLLGGRVAEEIACEDVSTGAENDFERATELVRQMVCRWGMSDLGPITFARGGPRFAGIPELGSKDERECSEGTSRAIDAEIALIVGRELERAREVLGARRDTLALLAHELLQKETLERGELLALAATSTAPRPPRRPSPIRPSIPYPSPSHPPQ